MTAYNKKWHVKEELCDFDAVSLYPSAMARISVINGPPKVIQDDQLNLNYLNAHSNAYVVEILITKVNKHYPFPLIVQKINGLNLNDDNNISEENPVTMVVDNIALEDLIVYQNIQFKLVRGYYWDEGYDPTIQRVIQEIFQKRVEYKRQNNPLQQIYKLIMNSCYGKTIEKPINKEWKYLKKGDRADNYAAKNYFRIIERIKIEDSDIESFNIKRPIDKHFNLSLLGVQVLSMSKRIMNEVMCLAYDIGCKIFYQDTDSMHIVKSDLPKLEAAFEARYNRKLIGNNLGQFHSDFTSDDGRSDVNCAVESYFIMKKTYIDKLSYNDGGIGYMSRAKGIPTDTRYIHADLDYDGNIMELYRSLYKGNEIEFNLLLGTTKFKLNSNQTITNVEKFPRTLKTIYEKGDVNTYFQ
ncbi:putative DNA polymerase [Histomonas meleagridis]|uniref:putative DNA polymerase n=1 Tax=Histomonas meleagridis TaxID=135588 RepID=UPI003559697B|nr:putative DNA polymerase [Histomonas meleagridis]KAH0798867.1 putative DNA polymerase [Histomonas meleagridis]